MAYDSITSHYSHRKRIDPVTIFVLAWKFLTNKSSPDVLVDVVTSPPSALTEHDIIECEVVKLARGRGRIQKKILLKALRPFIR